MEHEGDGDAKVSKGFCKWIGIVGNRKTGRDHPNYKIVKIYQNNEKSAGHLRRFAVTQIPVKDYQVTLVRKNHLE